MLASHAGREYIDMKYIFSLLVRKLICPEILFLDSANSKRVKGIARVNIEVQL